MELIKFYTNIINKKKANLMLNLLPHYYKIKEIRFKKSGNKGVFEIEGKNLPAQSIQETLSEFGYKCKVK